MRRMMVVLALVVAGGALAQDAPTLIPDWWARQPVFTIPPARPAAPTIDGRVDYREWYFATSVAGFIDMDTGNLGDLPVQMYVCYDASHVYVGVIVYRPAMNPTPRTTFEAGRHEHIWWQDDNFELVIQPGRTERGIEHFYAFVGNAQSAWSLMRGELAGTGGDSSWPADWQYASGPLGRESWSAELAIPVASLTNAEPPQPGSVWFMDLMNQQVTPAKRMVDLGLVWNLGMHGYRSPVTPKFVFVGENGPILRPHGVGRLSQTATQEVQHTGTRVVMYNMGSEPFTVNGRIQLFRAAGRPEGALPFHEAWDRIRRIRETGRPDTDPTQAVQAFRSEADILRELNERFEFVTERTATLTVQPAQGPDTPGAAFMSLEEPIANGEYLVAWEFTEAATGEVLHAQVVPYAVLPGLHVTLRPFFLKYQKVRAEASLANLDLQEGDEVRFVLSVGGRELATAAAPVLPGADAVHVYLDSAEVASGDEATVTARLVRADGTEVIANTARITRPPDPAWWPNQIGRSQVVPPPFEPVRADGERAFTLWQRLIEIGDDGLPRSVVARGTELLARPVALDLGGPAQWSCRQVSADDRDAVYEATGSAGPLALSMRTDFHYDGTGRFDLEITPPAGGATLQRLVLDIPVTEQFARLAYHHSTWTDAQRSAPYGVGGDLDEWFERYPEGFLPFTYACYLGAEDRGLQWFCEADRDWSNADEERVVGLVREDGAVVLRIAMVDAPLTITTPWRVTFGLTVTPVKDSTPGRQIVQAAMSLPPGVQENVDLADLARTHEALIAAGVNTVSTYVNDDEHFGEPSIANPRYEAAAREYAQQLHALGLRYMPYTGWGVNANIADFATFGQEMLAEPVKNIGWGCFLHNHASTFPDWWLWGARDLIERTGLDGVYMDGMAMPRLQFNELDGFAWTDRQGRPRGTWCIWAIRDFIERLYVYTHVEAPKPATIRNHYDLEHYAIGAFTDERVTGEGQYHAGQTVLEINSPAEFRANFMTHLNGVATTGLWWNWLNLPVTRNEMRAMFLLHDVPMVVGGGIVRYYGHQIGYGRETRPWVHLHKLRTAFADAEFIGYWQRPLVTCAPEGPLASAWVDRERGRALVVVSNLPNEPWSGTVTFDRQALGIAADTPAYEAMFDEPLTLDGDTLNLEIEPQRYRLIIFGDRVPVPANARID